MPVAEVKTEHLASLLGQWQGGLMQGIEVLLGDRSFTGLGV